MIRKRHPGEVRGHSKNKKPGSKHFYRRVYSGGQWDAYLFTHSVGSLLQVCCGGSYSGQVRVDLDPNAPAVNVIADALKLPLLDQSFDTVACDPIYEMVYPDRVHLQRELTRVARLRVIFKAPWIPRASGWRLQDKSLTLIGSHTCANVALMCVLDVVSLRPWRDFPKSTFRPEGSSN